MNIIDLVSAKAVKVYWDTRKDVEQENLLLDSGIFGQDVQLSDSIDVVTGESGYAPKLFLNAPDSKTIYRSRGSIEATTKKIPSFKEGVQIDEKDINDLMMLEGNQNQALYQLVLKNIFNDSYKLYQSSRVVRNLQICQILTTGSTSMSSNGSTYTVDYGVPSANKITLTSTAKWDAPTTADPLKDIRKWKKQLKINGDARAVCNATTFDLIANCDKIKGMLENARGYADVSEQDVIDLIYNRTKVKVYVDDTCYKEDDGTDTNYISNNIFSIFPAVELGKVVLAITPEQKMLMNKPEVNIAIVDEAIAVVTSVDDDAVTGKTKIAMKSLPRLDVFPDQILIATVA